MLRYMYIFKKSALEMFSNFSDLLYIHMCILDIFFLHRIYILDLVS